jgi:hypothetical protein
VIDADGGLIITNNHVIHRADKITVRLIDGRKLDAEELGSDPDTDVALIKVKAGNLTAIKFDDSESGRKRPAITRRSVVLPTPLAPSIAARSPPLSINEMLFDTLSKPNESDMFATASILDLQFFPGLCSYNIQWHAHNTALP